MTCILNVVKSLLAVSGWTMENFTMISHAQEDGTLVYTGYLCIQETSKTLVIRNDGTFEFTESED